MSRGDGIQERPGGAFCGCGRRHESFTLHLEGTTIRVVGCPDCFTTDEALESLRGIAAAVRESYAEVPAGAVLDDPEAGAMRATPYPEECGDAIAADLGLIVFFLGIIFLIGGGWVGAAAGPALFLPAVELSLHGTIMLAAGAIVFGHATSSRIRVLHRLQAERAWRSALESITVQGADDLEEAFERARKATEGLRARNGSP